MIFFLFFPAKKDDVHDVRSFLLFFGICSHISRMGTRSQVLDPVDFVFVATMNAFSGRGVGIELRPSFR